MKNANDCTARVAEMKEIGFIVIIIQKDQISIIRPTR
jgi:hypothetical protein